MDGSNPRELSRARPTCSTHSGTPMPLVAAEKKKLTLSIMGELEHANAVDNQWIKM